MRNMICVAKSNLWLHPKGTPDIGGQEMVLEEHRRVGWPEALLC